jgi:hypothetical protein
MVYAHTIASSNALMMTAASSEKINIAAVAAIQDGRRAELRPRI